jgi:flagellin-like protein
MKGISPMIATVLLIAFTIAIGGLISIFMNRLTTTTTGETEKSSTGIIECSNVRIDILSVTGAGSVGSLVITNPSGNKIYITGLVDNLANSSTVPAGYKTLTAGNTTIMTPINITSTATKLTIVGLCENTAQTSNISVTGSCTKGANCWPS